MDKDFSKDIINGIHKEREEAKEQKKALNKKIDDLQVNTNGTSDEWAFVENFLQPLIKKTRTEPVSDAAKTRKENDSNAATAANTCRCPIPNCAETLNVPTHKCHHEGCDLKMHNLCAQRENFTSDINELDMYCSLVHKNEQEG